MATLIVIFILLVTFHFVVEGIVVPVVRSHFASEIRSVRDSIVDLKLHSPDIFDDELFIRLEESVLFASENLSKFSIRGIVAANKEIQSDARLLAEREEFNNKLDACRIPEVKELVDRASKAITFSALVGISGWSLYLLPFIIVGAVFGQVFLMIGKLSKLSKDQFITGRTANIDHILFQA